MDKSTVIKNIREARSRLATQIARNREASDKLLFHEARVHATDEALLPALLGLDGTEPTGALALAARRAMTACGYVDHEKRAAWLKQNVTRLLVLLGGEEAKCRGCQRPIWWFTHANGKKAPYTDEGQNHFANCEAASTFRRKK